MPCERPFRPSGRLCARLLVLPSAPGAAICPIRCDSRRPRAGGDQWATSVGATLVVAPSRAPTRGAPTDYGREVSGYGYPLPAFAGTGFAGTTRCGHSEDISDDIQEKLKGGWTT